VRIQKKAGGLIMAQTQGNGINMDKLADALEPVIRRVVREELTRLLRENAGIFNLTQNMPLYEDMEEISQRKAKEKIKLHSHEEVWGE
jgi:hypothetical protein